MIALLITAALIAASGQAAPTGDAVSEARSFLDAFISNPQTTKDMVTSDALIAVHDIGGPYAEFLSGMSADKPLMAGCSVQSLEQKPTPPEADMREYPAPSFKTPGNFALVTGTFVCPTPEGRSRTSDVSVFLKDGRVVMFGIQPRRVG
jgi:hypothetical protein